MSHVAKVQSRPFFWLRYREIIVGFAIFLCAIALFSFSWPYSLSNWNYFLIGGVSTVGAERVLNGEIPYRDFWTMYAPGQYYLLAIIFQVFGKHLLVEVIAASIIGALSALLCYQIVLKLSDQRLLGISSAAIFVASTYNIRNRLGSYPPAILLILLAHYSVIRFYQTQKSRYLLFSGMATGLSILFKHDIGIYSSIVILLGVFVEHRLASNTNTNTNTPSLSIKFLFYISSTTFTVLPVLFTFSALAGRQMVEDLLIFPLTDFRFARPEVYPNILPIGVFARSPLELLENLTNYIKFAVPFFLLLLGFVGIGLAIGSRNHEHVALGTMFATAFLLHYGAAHVQINTHIVTMSIYGTFLGAIVYDLLLNQISSGYRRLFSVFILALVLGWFFSLLGKSVYREWQNRNMSTSMVEIEKVAGIKVPDEEAQNLTKLVNFVKSHVPPDQAIFVGLHRHDVIVIGDVMVYYLIDRPIATKFHELHPAIADTEQVQKEIISELRENEVSLIVLKHIFTNAQLDPVKQNLLVNLPHIGAKNLDSYILENFNKIRSFGPYEVWHHKGEVFQ